MHSSAKYVTGPFGKAALQRCAACCAGLSARARSWFAIQFAQQPAACVVALAMVLVAASAIVDTLAFAPRTKRVDSAAALQRYYGELGYSEPAVASGATAVPRVFLSRIPHGWTEDQPVAVKKSLFFRTLLPLVLKVNENIEEERRRLLQLAARHDALGAIDNRADRAWLHRLAVRYQVVAAGERSEGMPLDQIIATLSQRVDAVPPSLALAQAAVESGYGSSRFAVEGNALFGQWRTGGGMRPRAQPEHLSAYGVAAFPSPLHSVAAYAQNLNTFAAYHEFRNLRARQRARRSAGNSLALASTLTAYSEDGAAYVATLMRIIADNGLARYDAARLRPGRPIIVEPLAPREESSAITTPAAAT